MPANQAQAQTQNSDQTQTGSQAPQAQKPPKMKRPRGVYCLLASNEDITGDSTLTIPEIKGYRIRWGWKDAQPGMGAINLDYLKTQVAVMKANKKRCGIGVAAGVAIPPEAFSMGVQKFTLSPDDVSIENLPPDLAMPWDLKFQELYYKLVDALGFAFDKEPAVTYFVLSGFMQLHEDRLVMTPEDEKRADDLAKAAGYLDLADGWLQSSKAITARFIQAFPSTAIVLTTARPFPTNGSQIQGQMMDACRILYPGQFGNMTAGLKATLPPHVPNPNEPTLYPKGDQPIYSSFDHERFYGKDQPPPDPWPEDPQPVDDLLANGASKGDQWIELYKADAKNAANWPVMKTRGAELEANIPPGL